MTDQRRRSSDNDHKQPTGRIIETKFPLTWLISSATGIILAFGTAAVSVTNLTNKVERLIESNSNLEKRMNDRDARIDVMKDSIYDIKRTNDLQTLRLDEIERVSRSRK